MKSFLDMGLEGKSNAWCYIVGIIFIFAFYFLGYALILFVIAVIEYALGTDGTSEVLGPLGTFISDGFIYVIFILGIFITTRYIHKRPFKTLITPDKINWRPMLWGFALYFSLMFIMLLIQYLFEPSSVRLTSDWYSVLIFLPFILLLIPLQTTSEELVFRGYILQGTGLITRNFLILAILNGILFMLPHLYNPEVSVEPIVAISDYIVFGSVLAFITLKSGTAELAIGVHAATNIFISFISNYEDSTITTPSIFITTQTTSGIDTITGLLVIIALPVIFYVLTFKMPRIYNSLKFKS